MPTCRWWEHASIWLGLNPLVLVGDQDCSSSERFTVLEWLLSEKFRFHADISPDKETADKGNCARYMKSCLVEIRPCNQRIESSKAHAGFHSQFSHVKLFIMSWCRLRKATNLRSMWEKRLIARWSRPSQDSRFDNQEQSDKFPFTDGHHDYKYTAADSQLHMTFRNKEIVVDTQDVNYVRRSFISLNIYLLTSRKSDSGDSETSNHGDHR